MSSNEINTIWTRKTKTPEQKAQLTGIIRAATIPLGRLREILDEFEQDLNQRNYSEKDFEDPNWANKQAFRNGQLAHNKKIKDLLNFLKG